MPHWYRFAKVTVGGPNADFEQICDRYPFKSVRLFAARLAYRGPAPDALLAQDPAPRDEPLHSEYWN